MSNKIQIAYRCSHISCRNPKCYQAKLDLDREVYDRLVAITGNTKILRSPSNYCKLGTQQNFEILALSESQEQPEDRVLEIQKQEESLSAELMELQRDFQKEQDRIRTKLSALRTEKKQLQAVMAKDSLLEISPSEKLKKAFDGDQK